MNEKAISQYRRWKAYLRGALLGFVAACAVSIFPVVGIKKSWQPVIDDRIAVILLSVFVVVFTISASILWQKVSAAEAVKPLSRRTAKRIILTTFGGILFFLLFFSANALSLRLSIGAISGDAVRLEGIRYAGLLCALLGLALQLVAVSGFARFLRLQHPCCFATLIFLAGTPLAFGSWFALFALPGTFVVMKWAIASARAEWQEEPNLDDIRNMLEDALANSVLAAPTGSKSSADSSASITAHSGSATDSSAKTTSHSGCATTTADFGSATDSSSANVADPGSIIDVSCSSTTADSGSIIDVSCASSTAESGSAAKISTSTADSGSTGPIASRTAADASSATDISDGSIADSESAADSSSNTTAGSGCAAGSSKTMGIAESANQITEADSVSECESSTAASDKDSGAVISIKSSKPQRDWQIIPFLY